MTSKGEPAPPGAQSKGRPSRERTPLRIEVRWALGIGALGLVVAALGFWMFLGRIRDL